MSDYPLLDYRQSYPVTPGTKARDTSALAAAQMVSPAKILREKVYAIFRNGGEHTADEIAALLGVTVLAARPRLSELCARGLLMDSGVRRRNVSGKSAIAWKLV